MIEDFINKYFQYENSRYSIILYNYFDHIKRCNNEFIIDLNKRNEYLNTLNEILIDRDNIEQNIKSFSIENLDITLSKWINDNPNSNSNFDEIIELLDINIIFGIRNNIDLFKIIRDKLLILSKDIGFYNLNEALELLIGFKYKIIMNNDDENFTNKFNFISKTFIPLKYDIIHNDNLKKNTIKSSILSTKNDSLLDNNYNVQLDLYRINKTIIFEGYYMNDNLDIILRTIQNDNYYIKNKKRLFRNNISNIDDEFSERYIQSLTIGDIISLNQNDFIDKIKQDYGKYQKLSRMSFKNIMSEFENEKSTLQKQFEIIKLFLIGNTEHDINKAGLLFSLTKNKNINDDSLSKIIFNNLKFSLQIKLKRSSISLKSNINKIRKNNLENISVEERLAISKNMPDNIKSLILKKYDEMKMNNSDNYKQKMFIDMLLNYPWIDDSQINKNIIKRDQNISDKDFLLNIKKSLDEQVYGHKTCKETIMKLVGKWLRNSNSKGKVIGLQGPPGVGKTKIARSLGKVLSIPFAQINLGSMNDKSILNGHSYTYSASQPGLIIKKMIEAGESRCIMYFDELDKTSTNNGINEIFNLLIHVTDPSVNSEYTDAFFGEITFRLDQVFFIFSYNDEEKIDKILLDRMEKIRIEPYTVEDKLVIANKFMIKEIEEDMNMKNIIKIKNDDIKYIIETYTNEAGVRDLKNQLEAIYYEVNLDSMLKNNSKKPRINRKKIDNILYNEKNIIRKINDKNEVGIINGLYATINGDGGILPIIIYPRYDNKNIQIIITGSQGKVMRESVEYSFTVAINMIKEKYRREILNKFISGFHVHTPDGSTPKDGPSAGSAFTLCFLSLLLNKEIKKNIAITGEIEMNGNVIAVGGLEYKLTGAIRAGVKIVFVPFDNKINIELLLKKDKKIKKDLEIHYVKNIRDIIDMVFVNEDNEDDIIKYIRY